MPKFLRVLTSRIFLVTILLFFQLILLMTVVFLLSKQFAYLYAVLVAFSIIIAFWIVNKPDDPAFKLAWILPILIVPFFGSLFYAIFGGHRIGKHIKKTMKQIYKDTSSLLVKDSHVTGELKNINANIYNQVRYIEDNADFPVYKNTTVEYITPGEAKLPLLLAELEKAEHFIFLEYFIIEKGIMWDSILEILERKAKQGLDVRVMYDDFGCITRLPYGYDKQLKQKGISAQAFNPFRAHILSTAVMNNRDHRKIIVIDGYVGFTGGINLADEYINVKKRFGYWKDSSVMLKGEAVWNLTVMFLQLWNLGSKERDDYRKFKPHTYHPEVFPSDGYIQPYGDSPIDKELVGEMVYLNIINRATKYVYINSPYLIINHNLTTALVLAAKNGIDVRIMVPHIWDKWYAHLLSESCYSQLIAGGVKIYEYTPGFMHSKLFVSDDEVSVVGTINMDYRSLYLHFECGVFMYNASCIKTIKDDFLSILPLCVEVTMDTCDNIKWYRRFLRLVLQVFAPLL